MDNKEYQHQWYLRNRQKVIETASLWKRSHLERAKQLACEHASRYRKKHPEKHREANRHHWKTHIEEYRARSKQWYYEHTAKARNQNKEWKERNKEYAREWWKNYYKENKQRLLVAHCSYCEKNRTELREKDRVRRRLLGEAEWGSKEHLRKWCISNQIKPNNPEKQLISLFKTHGLPFKFVGDGQAVLGGKIPDFINYNGDKQIIELFGDYWHKPEEEARRREAFAKFGYETLIIWEHDLKNEGVLLSKIENWLEG